MLEGENPSLLQLVVAPGIPWCDVSRLQSLPLFSYGFSLFSFCSSLLCLVRTLTTGFRVPLDNLGWSHVKMLNFVTPAKVFFQIHSDSLT